MLNFYYFFVIKERLLPIFVFVKRGFSL